MDGLPFQETIIRLSKEAPMVTQVPRRKYQPTHAIDFRRSSVSTTGQWITIVRFSVMVLQLCLLLLLELYTCFKDISF